MNRVFESALATGNIAGAYLLEGASGEAVTHEADAFLMRLFCVRRSACGACPACQKYIARNHVDIMWVDAQGKSIKVDVVRDIAPFVYRKSYEGGYKAVVIPEAHELTEQAQNALLKVLEEPPADTVFILGSRDSKNLLPTILSRCIILKVCGNQDDAESRLAAEFGIATVKARILLRAANGDYYLAKRYTQENYFAARDDMIAALGRLLGARSMATSAIEKIMLQYEQQLEEALSVALLYLQDVINFKHTGNEAHVVNIDRMEDIRKHALESDKKLVNAADGITGFIVKCSQCPGLNKKLELTGTLFDILEVMI